MSHTRRGVLGLSLAGALLAVAPARGHTPYKQWVVYRKKHLLVGCHRDDDAGYALAKALAAHLVDELPAARARVARAPAASRLASLLATDQLDLAVLTPAEADAMRGAEGVFAAYGPIDLKNLAVLEDGRVLVAHERFPDDHAALIADAVIGSRLAPLDAQEAGVAATHWHPAALGVLTHR